MFWRIKSRGRVSLRPVYLSIAVYEIDDGWNVLGERAQDLHARVHQHEFHDGRDGPNNELPDDGARHAGDGANRAAVLGRYVARRNRRFYNGLPLERLDGEERSETRPH